MDSSNALSRLSSATRALALAKSLDEVKKIRDIAEAAETYARAAKLGFEAQNHAAEIKLLAERKAGELLGKLERKQGARVDLTSGDVAEGSQYAKVLTETNTSPRDASRWQTISTISPEKFEKYIEENKASKEITTSGLLKYVNVHVSHNTGENEWYTPPDYIEAARKVMGDIDCDPASSEIANETIRAKKIFTLETDGLKNKWRGNVWMNPPYGQPLIFDFCEAVSAKYENGEIKQACVLVNNATETTWFQRMLDSASSVCFTRGRIKFIDTEGNASGAPLQGQAILYFGGNADKFREYFSEFGKVLKNER